MTKINLNDYVWVELNENGWKALESYYKKLFSGVYAFAKGTYSAQDYVEAYKRDTEPHIIDGVERNLTRFQLHVFMNHFGDKMYMGAENVVVGNGLYFNLENKKVDNEKVDLAGC